MNKTDMKKTTYPLINTSVCQFTYEDYLEWCKETEVNPAEDNSSEFWQWCYDEAETNYNCNMDNLQYSKLKDRWFLIIGTLGLWWGRPTFDPVLIQGIVPAIKKCFGNCDDVYAELDIKEGVINVKSYHHDGTNYFTLLMLNKNGEKWAESAENRSNVIEYNNRWWTKLKTINDIWE